MKGAIDHKITKMELEYLGENEEWLDKLKENLARELGVKIAEAVGYEFIPNESGADLRLRVTFFKGSAWSIFIKNITNIFNKSFSDSEKITMIKTEIIKLET
jgi:hypothetical protein